MSLLFKLVFSVFFILSEIEKRNKIFNIKINVFIMLRKDLLVKDFFDIFL